MTPRVNVKMFVSAKIAIDPRSMSSSQTTEFPVGSAPEAATVAIAYVDDMNFSIEERKPTGTIT
jgi:hypothetical protein